MENIKVKEGLELPYRISYRVIKNFQMITGKGFESLDNPELKDIEIMFFEGLKSGYRKMHGTSDFPHTLKDLEQWLDDDFTLLERLSTLTENQTNVLNGAEETKEEPAKP